MGVGAGRAKQGTSKTCSSIAIEWLASAVNEQRRRTHQSKKALRTRPWGWQEGAAERLPGSGAPQPGNQAGWPLR